MGMPTRAEVEATLADRIATDPHFRDRLVSDPRGALSELLGVIIPESVHVVLHEESLAQIHLTIPASEDLTDDDLELVAGAAGGFDSTFNPWGCGYGGPGSCPPPPGSSGGCVMG